MPPPIMKASTQYGVANPTPAIAGAPTAAPTIAMSTVDFDILARPVTIRGQARF